MPVSNDQSSIRSSDNCFLIAAFIFYSDGVVGEDDGWSPVVESLDAALTSLGYIEQPDRGYHNQGTYMYRHKKLGTFDT